MSDTAVVYILAGDLKAGMRCSPVVNEPLYVVEDVAVIETGAVRITLERPDSVWRRVQDPRFAKVLIYQATDKMEVHLTLDEAIAEFRRLERLESDAMQLSLDYGSKRWDMAQVAQSLGWRG